MYSFQQGKVTGWRQSFLISSNLSCMNFKTRNLIHFQHGNTQKIFFVKIPQSLSSNSWKKNRFPYSYVIFLNSLNMGSARDEDVVTSYYRKIRLTNARYFLINSFNLKVKYSKVLQINFTTKKRISLKYLP